MTLRLSGFMQPDDRPRRYRIRIPQRLIVDTPAGWIERQYEDLKAQLDRPLSFILVDDMSPASLDTVELRTDEPELAALITTWVEQGMSGVERLAEMRAGARLTRDA